VTIDGTIDKVEIDLSDGDVLTLAIIGTRYPHTCVCS
jgi:hypothetical protein